MAKDSTPSESPGKKSKLPLIIGVIVALIAAGGGGVFVGGTLLAEKPAPKSAAHAAAAEDEESPAEEHAEGPALAAYTIDNLVLNPAGTEGTRFLMVTLALAPKDEAALAVMKERDAVLRDATLRLLERKTVPELTDVLGRDSLKVQIQQVLAKELPKNALRKVYLPQFVIQ
jgi:flagellar FliL protein